MSETKAEFIEKTEKFLEQLRGWAVNYRAKGDEDSARRVEKMIVQWAHMMEQVEGQTDE
jgi:hypothetical protein